MNVKPDYATAVTFVAIVILSSVSQADDTDTAPDYNTHIAPIFRKYCNGCHNADDAEGGLVLDAYASLLKGGESGAAMSPGKSETSRLIRLVEKKAKPFMPPEGSEGPNAEEIALLRRWIDAGAKGPDGKGPDPTILVTPNIAPVGKVRNPIQAIAWSPDNRFIAVARYQAVEILDGKSQKPLQKLPDHSSHVNDLSFSHDGQLLAVAAGEPGLFGETTIWQTSDWSKMHTLRGHRDSLYAVAISPDAKLLATGGYDQEIKIWDLKSGEERFALTGHNGPVFDLAFHPSGRILASASGDATVKLWNITNGERLDTLNEPEKDQYTVAFHPNGRYVAAGGVDNRIRVWEVREMGKEGTNPLIFARFSHDEPILALAYSPDGKVLVSSSQDRNLKVWNAESLELLHEFSGQSDWTPALAFSPDSQTLLVGRMDGSSTSFKIDSALKDNVATATPVRKLPVPKTHDSGITKLPLVPEQEPNNDVRHAMPVDVPATITGILEPNPQQAEDVDLFAFDAAEGETWVIETSAARKKSPADTKIEVLHADGHPVERLLLRAVRDSYITFRPIDSSQTAVRVKNWEEMELNQFVFMNGEVCKWFRMPQGPDSGMEMYKINGKRKCYFDTSATVHALEEPVYIVEPYTPGTTLPDNGLPVFPMFYANDDDGERKLGSDSRLMFTAPVAGTYIVRVTDVRGFSGKDFAYDLTIRSPKPDFTGKVVGGGMTIGKGSGQRFAVELERIDAFDGDVRIDIANLPPGFEVSTPIVVQEGHLEAEGVVNADLDAADPGKEAWEKVTITATAEIHGKAVTRPMGNLGEIKLTERPNAIAHLERDDSVNSAIDPNEPIELVITPGLTIAAMVRIDRFDDFKDEIRFDVENLPHGVIVDNLGLNGIMVREGEDRRQIFISAADWVPESTRLIHAVARSAGKQTSRPIRFRVKRPDGVAQVRN